MTKGHTVSLSWQDDRSAVARATGEQTILEAAESAGLALPFGCRTGACATCVAELVDGTIRYARPPRALKPQQIRDGYILPCIARPTAQCQVAVGTAVHLEMVKALRK